MKHKNNISGLDAYENKFYAAVKSHPELKTMSMFDYLIGNVICNKALIKDVGKLCKEINENNIKNDNTENIIKQLETLSSTCAVLNAQICHKFNLTTEPEKGFVVDLFMDKVFIEKKRQDKLWGQSQNHGIFWATVLGEEIGEFYEELDHIDRQVPDLNRVGNAIKELVQVAAVCFSWWKELCDA